MQAEIERLRLRLRDAPEPMMLSDANWDSRYEEWWHASVVDLRADR